MVMQPYADDGWVASLGDDDAPISEWPADDGDVSWEHEVREQLRWEWGEYDRLQREAFFRREQAREHWLRVHPVFSTFLDWQQSEHGELAQHETGNDRELLLERFLAGDWAI
jgi:hypothetical protein